MGIVICPICGGQLAASEHSVRCSLGHSFDIAREGYINLLAGRHKSGALTGDSREMALSRHDFLEKGYFAPLKSTLRDYIAKNCPTGAGLDICCGEGYYSDALGEREKYAFDLSREMVRIAARRKCASCFVANISAIPVADSSVSAAIHIFAPFHDREFSRVMGDDGVLLTVVAGKDHMMGMKRILYDTPYANDEKPPEAPSFRIIDKLRVSYEAELPAEDAAALLNMTPYGVKTGREGKMRLAEAGTVETELSFVAFAMKKIY